VRGEGAAERGLYAEDVKEVCCDGDAGDRLWLALRGELGVVGRGKRVVAGDVSKRTILGEEIFVGVD
jgi:hypothetical protein